MKIPLILILLAFLSSGIFSPLGAQEKYIHLIGHAEKNQALSADLSIIGQKVSGFVHPGLASPLAVKGEFIEPDSLVLYQHSSDKPLITARLNADGLMKGTLEEGNNLRPLELSASYPTSTHPFQLFAISSIQPLIEAPDSPFAVFEASIIIPDETMDNRIVEEFQSLVYINLFRTKTTMDSKTMLQNEQSAYFDQYRSKNIDINTTENYPMLNWEKRKVTSVVYNASDIVSLQYQDYTYTGGGAALEISRYMVFDFSSGKQIRILDIIPVENQPKISQQIREAICRKFELDPSARLTDDGFFSDEVFIPENLYITGYGIGFHYNTYELAGQETGPVSVFLSFDKIKGLVAPSELFKRLISN